MVFVEPFWPILSEFLSKKTEPLYFLGDLEKSNTVSIHSSRSSIFKLLIWNAYAAWDIVHLIKYHVFKNLDLLFLKKKG